MNDLYHAFFEEEKNSLGYQSESEYRSDLLACLDMMLYVKEQQKLELGKEEISETASSGSFGEGLQDLPVQLAAAAVHIRDRLSYTSEGIVFRFQYLAEGVGFSKWECFLLLLAFSVCADTRYEDVFSRLQEDSRKRLPSLGFAISLYQMGEALSDEEIAGAMQKSGILSSYFLEWIPSAEYNPMDTVFVLNGRACAYLYGGDEIGEELNGIAWVYRFKGQPKPVLIRQELKEQLKNDMLLFFQDTGNTGNVIQIYGADGIGKKYLLQSAAEELAVNLLFIDTAKLLMGTLAELRILFSRIILESILFGAVVCFTGYEYPEEKEEAEIQKAVPQGLWFLLGEIQREYKMAVWLSRKKADFLLGHGLDVLYLELPALTGKERGCLWEAYADRLPLEKGTDIERFAAQYVLTPRQIREVVWDVKVRAEAGRKEITKEDIQESVGRLAGSSFGGLAVFIHSVYTWEDLVIGEKQQKQLEMICNQVKYQSKVGEDWGFYKKTAYGRGICALFYGAPGTGKTMAAQVIANELGLALYRVDISQIISKYIGETEKNITELFRCAADTNALLFFDEADSLFSKRSEVKDSHDRNANIETAHLLQKLEDYEGVTVLATNYMNNMDYAFKRRIRFMVPFVFPAPDVRLKLWETILPKELPVEEEIDIAFFAKQFELSGSNIKEILKNAAFLAAAEERGLKNEDVIEAVRMDFEKSGRALTEKEFGYLL